MSDFTEYNSDPSDPIEVMVREWNDELMKGLGISYSDLHCDFLRCNTHRKYRRLDEPWEPSQWSAAQGN